MHILSQISVICLRVKTGLSPVPMKALILRGFEGTFEELACWCCGGGELLVFEDIWLGEFATTAPLEEWCDDDIEALDEVVKSEEVDLGDDIPNS